MPQSDLGNVADLGWHAMASLGMSWWMQPISFRLDAAYNRFAASSGTGQLGQGCAEETRFGWNAGLGTHLYFLTVRSFVEARYHAAGDGLSYLPVTIGFSF